MQDFRRCCRLLFPTSSHWNCKAALWGIRQHNQKRLLQRTQGLRSRCANTRVCLPEVFWTFWQPEETFESSRQVKSFSCSPLTKSYAPGVVSQRHIRVHQCTMAFVLANNCKFHLRVHAMTKKTNGCSLCTKAFAWSTKLQTTFNDSLQRKTSQLHEV